MNADDAETLARMRRNFRRGLLVMLRQFQAKLSLNELLVLCAMPASKQSWISSVTGVNSSGVCNAIKNLRAWGYIEPVLAGQTLSEWRTTDLGDKLLSPPTTRQVEEAAR